MQAAKEVILSAGAFNTPHLLQLSGIGPRAELEALGIEVLVDNPSVGQNLSDHVLLPNQYFVNGNDTLDAILRPSGAAQLEELVQEWTERKTGPLANGVTSQLGYFRLPERYLEGGDPATGPTGPHWEMICLVSARKSQRVFCSWLTRLCGE